jgi:hypothetical protein
VLPPPESSLGSQCLEAFRASGLDYPHAAVIADAIDVRISFLATGRFLTLLNPTVLRFPTKRQDILALPIKLPIVPASIGIFTLKNRVINPVAKLFIEHARELARRQ